MPFKDLNNNHFTDADKETIRTAMEMLNAVLEPKVKTLTPKERMKYGSVNERKKLFINKVWDFRRSQPGLSATDVDWEESEKDHQSRTYLENLLLKVDRVRISLQNSKILHDWDNYHDSLIDYRYTKYKLSNGVNGYEMKAKELFQFFDTSLKASRNELPPSDPATDHAD